MQKLIQILAKITKKFEKLKKQRKLGYRFQSCKPILLPGRKKSTKNIFSFDDLRLTSVLLRQLTTMYDEYVDWQKLIQHRNSVDHIVPPPLKGAGTMAKSQTVFNDF